MSHTPNDKPLGASLGWELLGTTRPYESRWHNLRRDEVRLPSGQEIVYTYQAVSYTHLDVYKRQPALRAGASVATPGEFRHLRLRLSAGVR